MTELFHLFAAKPIVDRTVERVRGSEPLWTDLRWVRWIASAIERFNG